MALILLKILAILLMGLYINKKTYDPVDYFSKKPHIEICKRDEEIKIKEKEKDEL